MSSSRHLSGLLLLTLALGCARTSIGPNGSTAAADLILRSGNIVTVDDTIGTVEALAIRGGRIVAVGTNDEVDSWIGSTTRVIDLAGKTAIPGFIEGHGHFVSIGRALQTLDLTKVNSWDEVIQIVSTAVANAEPGAWILGRGWHQEKWSTTPVGSVKGFPVHDDLSAVSPENPVGLTHASGHACFFNLRAMELASIDSETPDPPGGEIVRDEQGRAIGIFLETAQGLVRRVHAQQQSKRTPAQEEADLRRAIRLADEECLAKGITSFQDAGSSYGTIDLLKTMAERGEISVRLWVMIREGNRALGEKLSEYRMIGVADDRFTVRAIKRLIDGALGARGAWLLEPYSDLPTSHGMNNSTIAEIEETARLAIEHDFQLCVHAIGDRANREVLDVFERTFEKHPGASDLRWRIEHAQHLNPSDIPRFARLGVVASMQAVHCTSDGPWVVARLGRDRAEQGAYVWQKLIQSGALVSNGTDAPVEDVSPLDCYYASVSRRLEDGSVFFADQRMDRMQALKSYTINCAKAAFEEDIKGTLVPGKLADIVVLSKDILTIPENEIRDTEVLYTIVGGEVRFAEGWRAEHEVKPDDAVISRILLKRSSCHARSILASEK